MEVTHESAKTDDPSGFNQNKLIEQFGSKPITPELIERIKTVCKVDQVHHFITRGIFFSHRDLDHLLNKVEAGKRPYIYTGRGPSTGSMHIGHLVPFMMTKYLQELFDAELFIQITDDEKFLYKGEYKLEEYLEMADQNIRDIIACGFNPERTHIIINSLHINHLYPTALKIAQKITYNQMRATFGFKGEDNVGKSFFPTIQMAPAIPTVFGMPKDTPCIIPCAIDQDPYFRLLRDVTPKLKYKKPVLIHSTFMPALQGCNLKMSSSDETSVIFLTDSAKKIKKKIGSAFSGGRDSAEEHRELGGVPEIDVSFRYLTIFMEDDEELAKIEESYRSGKLLTGDLKKITTTVITQIIKDHQKRREGITKEEVKRYLL